METQEGKGYTLQVEGQNNELCFRHTESEISERENFSERWELSTLSGTETMAWVNPPRKSIETEAGKPTVVSDLNFQASLLPLTLSLTLVSTWSLCTQDWRILERRRVHSVICLSRFPRDSLTMGQLLKQNASGMRSGGRNPCLQRKLVLHRYYLGWLLLKNLGLKKWWYIFLLSKVCP